MKRRAQSILGPLAIVVGVVAGIVVMQALVDDRRHSDEIEYSPGALEQLESSSPHPSSKGVSTPPTGGAPGATSSSVESEALAVDDCLVGEEVDRAMILGRLAEYRDLNDGWYPTPEGLYFQFPEQWDQEAFLEYLDSPIGIPTIDDCITAYRSFEVRSAHLDFLDAEILVTTLNTRQKSQRGPDFNAILEAARARRDAARERLLEACDRFTGYKDWRRVEAMFLEWAR